MTSPTIQPTIQAEAFVAYVERELKTLHKRLREVVKTGKKSAVHQARVASRRLETVLHIARPGLDWNAVKPAAKLARTVRRRLGKLRDLQVMRESLRSRGRDVADPIVKALDDRIESTSTKMRQQFSSADLSSERTSTAALTKAIRRSLPAIETLVRDALRDALKAFDHGARNLDVMKGKASGIHRLRVAGKQLRYTLEIATVIGVTRDGVMSRQLKQAQDRLGAWHDAAVIVEFIAGHLVEARTLERDPPAAVKYLSLACAISDESLAALRAFEISFRRGRGALRRTADALSDERKKRKRQ